MPIQVVVAFKELLKGALRPKALKDVSLAPPLSSATADCFKGMSEAIRGAQAAMQEASSRNKCYASKKRRGESFREGDEALLLTQDITPPAPEDNAKKLLPKCIGPLTIMQKIGPLNCKLLLPPPLGAHPAFHAGKLRRRRNPEGASRVPKPPQPDAFPDGRHEQEVEKIISHRFQKKPGRLKKSQAQRPAALQCLARCKGFTPTHEQCARGDCLDNCRDTIEDCKRRVGAALTRWGSDAARER